MTRVYRDPMDLPVRGGGMFVFGQHLVMNLTECPRDLVTSRAALTDYVAQLVEAIDMVTYGEVQIPHFGHDNPNTSGFSVLQMIETSLISGHLVDATGRACWDVFSCKRFDVDTVLDLTERFFGPATLGWTVLWR